MTFVNINYSEMSRNDSADLVSRLTHSHIALEDPTYDHAAALLRSPIVEPGYVRLAAV